MRTPVGYDTDLRKSLAQHGVFTNTLSLTIALNPQIVAQSANRYEDRSAFILLNRDQLISVEGHYFR